MNLKDLKNMDKDDLLGLLGLEQKSSTSAWVAGTLGTFGVGLLVGAGIALLLAPKPGRELREDIRDKLRRAPNDAAEAISSAVGRSESMGGVGKTY
jgi:gas vesicle protein